MFLSLEKLTLGAIAQHLNHEPVLKSEYIAHKARVDSLSRLELEEQNMLFECDMTLRVDAGSTINPTAISRYVQNATFSC